MKPRLLIDGLLPSRIVATIEDNGRWSSEAKFVATYLNHVFPLELYEDTPSENTQERRLNDATRWLNKRGFFATVSIPMTIPQEEGAVY